MHILFAVIAALVGGILEGGFGVLFGGMLGLVLSLVLQQRQLLEQLRTRVDGLDDTSARHPSPPQAPASVVETRAAREPEPPPSQPVTPPPRPVRAAASAGTRELPRREPSDFEQSVDRAVGAIRTFFTTGNLVVRIGVVVLFFGVAFLLRYAYEHALLPVQLRLAGAALGGIVLTAFGWRLRHRADTYGLILQGAGVGVLYLTIFAAARLYTMLPMSGAFALLVVLVAGSCVLALLQKSQALAIFAMSGGFLAPVLVSTGSGSHVALFSYYALLNAGILVMAWFQFWRWLNWVGFVFTFAIGATWGYQYYRPEYFSSTEPFLLLSFFYYLGVSVLFARRQAVELRGVLDGTLVFGTPIVVFALQATLVRDMEFGLAFSALGTGLTYLLLALWLKRSGAFAGLLGQSFVALAVVFATLVIPFAFDNQRFTAASWALEGAGLYWVGLRQQQLLPRLFGLLLQVAAAVAFLLEIGSYVAPTLFWNSAFLGAALLGLAGGFTAYLVARHRDELRRFEAPLRWVLLGWGVAWWFAGGVREIARYRPGDGQPFTADNIHENLFVLFAAVSFAALTAVARRFNWREALLPGFLLLPVALLSVLWLDRNWQHVTLFAHWGWLAWPLAAVVVIWHLRQAEQQPALPALWHAGYWWFLTLLSTWNIAAVLHGPWPDSVWSEVVWGALPLAFAALMLRLRGSAAWPFAAHPGAYFGWGWAGMLLYLLLWLLVAGEQAGDPDPLPYIVLVNPLELVQLAVLLLAVVWIRRLPPHEQVNTRQGAWVGLAAVSFLWVNLVAIRAVHFYADVAYPVEHIFDSDAFQTTASILWTAIALALMGIGTRRSLRSSWLAGAALLGVVLVKLFAFDLGRLDMLARIVSFLSVGVLMLVIGYFAPLPPNRTEETAP